MRIYGLCVSDFRRRWTAGVPEGRNPRPHSDAFDVELVEDECGFRQESHQARAGFFSPLLYQIKQVSVPEVGDDGRSSAVCYEITRSLPR
jgi:hypothetical protein